MSNGFEIDAKTLVYSIPLEKTNYYYLDWRICMEKMTLSDGKSGCKYKILEIADEERLKIRVSSMGLMPGQILEVCQNLKKQPVLVFARDTLIAIGRGESEKIMIGGIDNE